MNLGHPRGEGADSLIIATPFTQVTTLCYSQKKSKIRRWFCTRGTIWNRIKNRLRIRSGTDRKQFFFHFKTATRRGPTVTTSDVQSDKLFGSTAFLFWCTPVARTHAGRRSPSSWPTGRFGFFFFCTRQNWFDRRRRVMELVYTQTQYTCNVCVFRKIRGRTCLSLGRFATIGCCLINRSRIRHVLSPVRGRDTQKKSTWKNEHPHGPFFFFKSNFSSIFVFHSTRTVSRK